MCLSVCLYFSQLYQNSHHTLQSEPKMLCLGMPNRLELELTVPMVGWPTPQLLS